MKSLQKHGFNAGALHGDMDQSSRTATLDAFREGRITLLAASDVAARGLDIPDVSHIFNFDVPWQSDDYVHRIGRTGRAGKEGRSLTLVTPDDIKQLKDIEKMLGAPVTWIGEPPSAEDIANGARRRGRGRRGGARSGAGEPREARSGGRWGRGGERHRPERKDGAGHANGSQPEVALGQYLRISRGQPRPERGPRERLAARARPATATGQGAAGRKAAAATLGTARAATSAAARRRPQAEPRGPWRSRPGLSEEDHAHGAVVPEFAT